MLLLNALTFNIALKDKDVLHLFKHGNIGISYCSQLKTIFILMAGISYSAFIPNHYIRTREYHIGNLQKNKFQTKSVK